MALATNSTILAKDVDDWVNANLVNDIRNRVRWNKENTPPGSPAEWKSFFGSGTLGDFVLPRDRSSWNGQEWLPVLSVNNIYNATNALTQEWESIRRLHVTGRRGNNTNNGPVTYSVFFEQTEYAKLASYSTGAIMCRTTFQRGDAIRLDTIGDWFSQIYSKWASLPTLDKNWDECHSNCHGSCHGSGGWR